MIKMKLDELAEHLADYSTWTIVDMVQSVIADYVVKREIAESQYENILAVSNRSADSKTTIADSKALDVAFNNIHQLSDLYANKIYNIIIKKYSTKKLSFDFGDNNISLDLSSFYGRYKDLESALGENYKDKNFFNDIIRLEAYKFCFERSLKDGKF